MTTPVKKKLKATKISYLGKTSEVYKIWIGNFFLTMITLGIYRFWGKTRLRKYVANHLELNSERFEYLGTGKELFLGFLKIIPIYLAIMVPFILLPESMQMIIMPLFYILVFYIIHVAVYSALRYRVNRLSWSGIRGIMRGSAWDYGKTGLMRTFLNIITLGYKIPESDITLYGKRIDEMSFGNIPFKFSGSSQNLTRINIITILLAPFTLFFSRIWYQAALQKEFMRGTSLDNFRFKSTFSGTDLLKHVFINLLIFVFTLGLGTPIIMQRNLQFFVRNLIIGGDLDTSKVIQEAKQNPGSAEGLDDLFDLDTGLI